jgi:hypothetical protein
MQMPIAEVLASDHRDQLLSEAHHDAFVRRARSERPGRAGTRRRMRALVAWGLAGPRYAFRHSFRGGLRALADEGSRARRPPLDAGSPPAASGLTHP